MIVSPSMADTFGAEKLKAAGLNLRVIPQKLRALRGHCVTTRPLAAWKYGKRCSSS
jgi:hypothetical protein